MKYLCLVYAEEKNLAAIPANEIDDLCREAVTYENELAGHGRFVIARALENVATATTLRLADGQLTVTDGPFAETKEQLLGFFLIEAGDRDEAIRIAARIPPLRTGCVEVRPVKDLTAYGQSDSLHHEPAPLVQRRAT